MKIGTVEKKIQPKVVYPHCVYTAKLGVYTIRNAEINELDEIGWYSQDRSFHPVCALLIIGYNILKSSISNISLLCRGIMHTTFP